MKDCLFLPAGCGAVLQPETPLYWQPVVGTGKPLHWSECATALSDRSCALVIPMTAASACAIKLPTLKPRWLRQALPYAVEDWLADDVEHLHLALGEQLANGCHLLLAVPRKLLQGWLEQLATQSVQITAIYVDADLLPRDAPHALLYGEQGLLGGAGELRLAFQRDNWANIVSCLDEQSVQKIEDPCPWPLLAAGQTRAINLAQGEFAIQQAAGNSQWWRRLALLSGLWLLLQLGFDLTQSWYLQRQGDLQAAASLALYQQLFPQDTRIVNLKAQFADHLNQRTDNQQGTLFVLLQQASQALGTTPQLRVQQLDFNQTSGDLALQLQADDFASLEQFRQRLLQAGLQVQLGSASREAQGVSARMLIGGGA